MLCDRCNDNLATVFITKIIGAEAITRNLCMSCGGTEGKKAEEWQMKFIHGLIESHSSPEDPIGIAARECERLRLLNRELVENAVAAHPSPAWESTCERLASADGRFRSDAFRMVARALFSAGARPGRHVSGAEIAEAFRLLVIGEFGASALTTLQSWGIRSTDDIGEVVFRMAEAGLMKLRSEDKREHFHSIYEFADAFPAQG